LVHTGTAWAHSALKQQAVRNPLVYLHSARLTGAVAVIASLSGVRGILNRDLSLADVSIFAANFGRATGSRTFLMARDPRSTGPAISRAAAAGMMSRGATVFDYGIISTPALFRESRTKELPALMVTASHNEPEFNGLKFLVEGAGIGKELFDEVIRVQKASPGGFELGSLKPGPRPSYVYDLIERFGAGSCEGIRVAVDLGGGAAISHTVPLLRMLGCEVASLNDQYGVFSRRVDPISDDLLLLRKVVKQKGCDVGLGFDCDGDRLAIVDPAGRKRTGDYMLSLAISEMLRETGDRKVVVSLDTTQAVDDVVKKAGGRVFRSRVGEASVVGMMKETRARLGGEGSSGGLIDGSFNYCRDSMLAALAIIRALRAKGREFYDSVPLYHQERVALGIPKAKALRGIRRLAAKYDEADLTDGFKLMLHDRNWVLIRPSGTEDVVRVSAEAGTIAKAKQLSKTFAKKLKELSS
jgi:phosphomannomutase/phosphoglucomutase